MLDTATIMTGSTTHPFTGGLNFDFATLDNGEKSHLLYLDNSADFLDRIEIEGSVLRPRVQVNAPNGYTQKKTTMFVKKPKTLANGNRTVTTCLIVLGTDIETSEAENVELRRVAAQTLITADFAEFWYEQSKA